MPRVLTYTIKAKDEFSDIFDRLINLSETASGFIVAKLGIEAAQAIGTMTSESVEDFTEVELSLKRIAAAVGAFGTEADQLGMALREQLTVGAELGFTLNETAQAVQLLTMAGYTAEDAFTALMPILQTATIETMSLQEAVTLTTTIIGMYGLGAKDAARVTEVLANAAIQGILPISKIGMGLAYVGKQAAAMGTSLEETTAALVHATNQGLRAHMAGRYLRRTLEDLVINEDKLGFSIRDATGQMLPLINVLEKLDDYLKTLGSETERDAYLIDIFGVQAKTLVYALTGVNEEGRKNVDILRELAGNMGEVGTAVSMTNEIMDTFWGTMRKFRAELSQVSVGLGEALTPLIKAFTPIALSAARVVKDTLTPALRMVTSIVHGLTPAFQAIANVASFTLPILSRLAIAYLSLKFAVTGVLWAVDNFRAKVIGLTFMVAGVTGKIMNLIVALRMVPAWFSVIAHRQSIVLARMAAFSPVLAGFVAGLRGVTGWLNKSTRAMQAYTVAIWLNQKASAMATIYMNTLGKALQGLAAIMGATTAQATLLAYAIGGALIIIAIFALIEAVKALGRWWSDTMRRIRDSMAGATSVILRDLEEIRSTLNQLQTEMAEYGRNINALNMIYQMNEMRIRGLQEALEEGTISAEEAAIAIAVLTEANKKLTPIIEEARLQEGALRDEIDAMVEKANEEADTLEKLRQARIMLNEAIQAEVVGRRRYGKQELEELKTLLDDLGISYKKVSKGWGWFKRELIDFSDALETLDVVIEDHEATSEELGKSIEDLQEALSDLTEEAGMSTSEWEMFWQEIEATTSMRGRSMLSVLEQIGVALGKLDYVFGATSREIQRLNLRYRENELMIREIEKAMREGKISYVEGSAQIRALRKENEELALARDEARLEQDKLNLAMDEATATVEAYEHAITSIIRENEALLKRKYELEEKMRSGAELTEEEQKEYEGLNEAIVENQAKLDDLTSRLDAIKERFPAIEEGMMNLRESIREFAGTLSQDFIGPVDTDLMMLFDDMQTVFSTEFDFVPPEVDWTPIFDTLREITETEWTLNIKLLLDQTGLGELDEIIDTIEEGGPPPTEEPPVDMWAGRERGHWWDPWMYPEEEGGMPAVVEDTATAMDAISGALELLGEAQLTEAEGYIEFSRKVGEALTGAKQALEGSLEKYGEAQLEQAESYMALSTDIAERLTGFVEDPIGSISRGLNELGGAVTSLFSKPRQTNVNVTINEPIINDKRDITEIAEDLAWEIYYAEEAWR